MQLAGVACCGHGDKASLFIVRGQKPLTRTERERHSIKVMQLAEQVTDVNTYIIAIIPYRKQITSIFEAFFTPL